MVDSLLAGDFANADELSPRLADDDKPDRPGLSAHEEALAAKVQVLRGATTAATEPEVNHHDRDDGHLADLDRLADDMLDVQVIAQSLR